MKQTMLKKALILIAVTLLAAFAFSACSSDENMQGSAWNSKISIVKDGNPMLIPNITYGEAYEHFFSDTEWRGFESDEGKDIVEFSGGCTYMDEDARVYIQFTLDDEEFYINYASLTINGEEFEADFQTYLELAYNPFESYSNEVLGEELDEEAIYFFEEAFTSIE